MNIIFLEWAKEVAYELEDLPLIVTCAQFWAAADILRSWKALTQRQEESTLDMRVAQWRAVQWILMVFRRGTDHTATYIPNTRTA